MAALIYYHAIGNSGKKYDVLLIVFYIYKTKIYIFQINICSWVYMICIHYFHNNNLKNKNENIGYNDL